MARILIIDDSAFSRRVLRSHLEKAGHEVIEVGDGLSGIERFALERPDAVTLDMTMTGLHGLEVLEQLRQIDPAVKVMIATADIQSATRQMVTEAGAVGFIQKPFVAEDVAKHVADALRGTDSV